MRWNRASAVHGFGSRRVAESSFLKILAFLERWAFIISLCSLNVETHGVGAESRTAFRLSQNGHHLRWLIRLVEHLARPRHTRSFLDPNATAGRNDTPAQAQQGCHNTPCANTGPCRWLHNSLTHLQNVDATAKNCLCSARSRRRHFIAAACRPHRSYSEMLGNAAPLRAARIEMLHSASARSSTVAGKVRHMWNKL